LSCLHTRVDARYADHEGWLVLADGYLIAVLVCLDEDERAEHGCAAWRLEASFGPCANARADPFPTIADALDWVRARLLQEAVARSLPASGRA